MCGGEELRHCTGGEARALFCRDPLCTDRQTDTTENITPLVGGKYITI